MPRGYLDTTHIDFPPNVDEAYLRGLENERGMSWESALQTISTRIQAASQVVDPLVAALAYFTPDAVVSAPYGESFDLEEENEYGLVRPEVAEPPRGQMLPLRRWAKSIGLTEQGLEEITEAELVRQLDAFLLTFTRGLTLRIFRRLTSAAEEYVDRKTTSVSPGFAGSGTGDNVFSGTYPDGTALAGGYTHYYRDTAANLALALATMRDQLARWHPGPYDLIGSQAQIAAVMALAGFTKATSDLILRAQGVAAANVDNARYVGVYGDDVRVWIGRLEWGSSANLTMFKTYGDFSARNALAIRYDDRFGRDIDIKYRAAYPLDQAIMRRRFGIGVSDRTAAANLYVAASGSYTAPTIA